MAYGTACLRPQGLRGLYNGFGISVIGIIPFRRIYIGMNDSLAGINPYSRQ